MTAKSVKHINKEIAHTGLKLYRYNGYFVFLDIEADVQIGDSIMVYSFKHLPLERWISDAEAHAAEYADEIEEARMALA